MRREPRWVARRWAAEGSLLALLGMASLLPPATPTVQASTVHLHYEDAFDDVRATEETETEIKAAFLLRFPDFIDWPAAPQDTLHIAVVGDDRLARMLAQLAAQENAAGLGIGRVLAVTAVEKAAQARHCEILVLGEQAVDLPAAELTRLHAKGTLTVGVWDRARGGTIIHLFREGNRVRFDIRQTLAREAGLLISSKLLNLAREQSLRLLGDRFEPARG